MIDPTDIINYNRTDEELEEFYLFCLFVAVKWKEISEKLYPDLTDQERDLKVWKQYSGR